MQVAVTRDCAPKPAKGGWAFQAGGQRFKGDGETTVVLDQDITDLEMRVNDAYLYPYMMMTVPAPFVTPPPSCNSLCQLKKARALERMQK